MTFVENSNSYQYHTVVKVFIELRNKGVSLSAFDLDILNQWEKNSLNPEFICRVIQDIYLESQKTKKAFPAHLLPIANRIDKILLKARDV